MTQVSIHRVSSFDLVVQPWAWPFAQARRAEIDAHFADLQRERPRLWNGQVLLGRNAVLSGGHLSAEYFVTDFASFLAWRDWSFPDREVFNGFGMGALRSRDGAFALGVMGAHTANAGRIYFPSGTPDLDDISDGRLDLEGSMVREIEEETGLTSADYQADAHWHSVVTGPAVAMIRILRVDLTGEALRERIERNISRQHHPELAGIRLVRGRGDFAAAMPRFVTAFLEAQFPA
jgi:8-oxo-dGTP pyrophosphatase MutT (NUDIX family)